MPNSSILDSVNAMCFYFICKYKLSFRLYTIIYQEGYTHYTFKVENLTKYFNHNIKNLKFKHLCVSSAELVLGNKTNRDEFIKMVTESKKEAVYKLLNKKYNFDTDVVDYLLSRTFSSLSNKVENIVKEKLELEKDLKVFEDKLRDIDTYLINEIKTKVKKYK